MVLQEYAGQPDKGGVPLNTMNVTEDTLNAVANNSEDAGIQEVDSWLKNLVRTGSNLMEH